MSITPETPPNNLDELLDLAFLYKEKGNGSRALYFFRHALQTYPESTSVPFIVIEIANILKRKGSYDEAIQVFSNSRSLSALQEDKDMDQEFVNAIAYLRIIKNILISHNLGFIPFDEISKEIIMEIDTEFREWRSLG